MDLEKYLLKYCYSYFFPEFNPSLNSNKTFQSQMSLKREGDQYQVSSVLDY